jgi:hypothetical protein
VKELNNYIEESQLLVPKMKQIDDLLNKLNTEEEYVKRLRNKEGTFETDTLKGFADGIISNNHDSVTSRMAAIFNMVIGTPSSSGHNFIDLFMQSVEVRSLIFPVSSPSSATAASREPNITRLAT